MSNMYQEFCKTIKYDFNNQSLFTAIISRSENQYIEVLGESVYRVFLLEAFLGNSEMFESTIIDARKYMNSFVDEVLPDLPVLEDLSKIITIPDYKALFYKLIGAIYIDSNDKLSVLEFLNYIIFDYNQNPYYIRVKEFCKDIVYDIGDYDLILSDRYYENLFKDNDQEGEICCLLTTYNETFASFGNTKVEAKNNVCKFYYELMVERNRVKENYTTKLELQQLKQKKFISDYSVKYFETDGWCCSIFTSLYHVKGYGSTKKEALKEAMENLDYCLNNGRLKLACFENNSCFDDDLPF